MSGKSSFGMSLLGVGGIESKSLNQSLLNEDEHEEVINRKENAEYEAMNRQEENNRQFQKQVEMEERQILSNARDRREQTDNDRWYAEELQRRFQHELDFSTFKVSVPKGKRGGQLVGVTFPTGEQRMVAIPEGLTGGCHFQVVIPNSSSASQDAEIPQTPVLSEEQQAFLDALPEDIRNEVLSSGAAQFAPATRNEPLQSPHTPKIISVIIPEGVPPGGSFPYTIPNSQESVSITVPPGIEAGEEIAINVSEAKEIQHQVSKEEMSSFSFSKIHKSTTETLPTPDNDVIQDDEAIEGDLLNVESPIDTNSSLDQAKDYPSEVQDNPYDVKDNLQEENDNPSETLRSDITDTATSTTITDVDTVQLQENEETMIDNASEVQSIIPPENTTVNNTSIDDESPQEQPLETQDDTKTSAFSFIQS